jgi:hypothetical protein
MSQEVAQREIENPYTLFHIYLDNPRLSKYTTIPFKAPTNVGIPSHSNKTHHYILKNITFHSTSFNKLP